MNIKLKVWQILSVITLFVSAPGLTHAQGRLELSMEGAVNYAIEHNRMMQNASYSVKESQAGLKSTIAQGLPQVEAKIDYQNFFNSEASIGPMTFEFKPTSNLNFSVGQLIFSGNYIVGVQMSMLFREMSEVNLKKTDADIRAQVLKSYYLVLVSAKSKEIMEKNVNNLDDVITKTNTLVSAGVLDGTDRDQIAIQKTMLQNAVRSAERQLEMALNLLRLQLGVSANTEIQLSDNLESILLKVRPEQAKQNSFDLQQNNDFQLMMLQRKLAAKKVLMEKSKFLPTVSGFYSYTEKLKEPELDFSPKQIIGFNISIPIFSSGSRYFSHAQARYQQKAVENQLELLSDQLSIQEKQLRFNLKTAIEQYQAQKENAELAARVYDNIYLKYQQGIVSGIDMTTANSNKLQAENSYIMAIMQLLDANTEMIKLTNQLPK